MLPIYFTENEDGDYQIDTSVNEDTIISNMSDVTEIDIDNLKSDNHHHHHHHHSIYEEWTRMTPQDISRWIDK
jgi:hypothetical protein